MIKKHYITDKQNAIDIAILNYGEADRVFALIKANEIGLENSLDKGSELILPDIDREQRNDKLLAYFRENNIRIATAGNIIADPICYWLLTTAMWDDYHVWSDNCFWND